jgi:hypothetical protein
VARITLRAVAAVYHQMSRHDSGTLQPQFPGSALMRQLCSPALIACGGLARPDGPAKQVCSRTHNATAVALRERRSSLCSSQSLDTLARSVSVSRSGCATTTRSVRPAADRLQTMYGLSRRGREL